MKRKSYVSPETKEIHVSISTNTLVVTSPRSGGSEGMKPGFFD